MRREITATRPGAPIIVAILALVAAIAGTALAGPSAGTSALSKKTVKKIVKQLAPSLSVAHADTANTANIATEADHASNADNAARLDGQDASSFRVGCPPGTTRSVGVCFENTPRAKASFSNALTACADADARLPSLSELWTFAGLPGVTLGTGVSVSAFEWTGDALVDANTQAFGVTNSGGSRVFTNFLISEQVNFRCVRPLSN